MPQRKPWTSQEDKILKLLRDDMQITKWSTIAKRMSEQYNMPDRTGKQCRQRYHNHLDSTILRAQWTLEEEQYLYKLHDEIGNKWAIIAQKLPGRTDNCVKNHFYSKMRKAIRKLNKIIYQYFKKQIKQIKMTVLYKIVEATDLKFKNNDNAQQEVSEKCCRLKNTLLSYSNDGCELENDIERLAEIAKEIHQFSSRYRRKAKKTRRSSAQGADLLKIPKFQLKLNSASDRQQGDSQYSMNGSHECEDEIENDNENENDESFEMEEPIIVLEAIKQVPDELKQSSNSKIMINEINNKIHEKKQQNQTKPGLIKPPSIYAQNNISRGMQTGEKLEEMLRNQGVLQNSIQIQGPIRNHHGLKGSLGDSVRSVDQQFRMNTNFLSQSIQKMKIGDMSFQVEVEDQNKLFVSN